MSCPKPRCHCRDLTWDRLFYVRNWLGCYVIVGNWHDLCYVIYVIIGVYTTTQKHLSSEVKNLKIFCRSMSRGRRSPSPRRRGRSGSSGRRSNSRWGSMWQLHTFNLQIFLISHLNFLISNNFIVYSFNVVLSRGRKMSRSPSPPRRSSGDARDRRSRSRS